MSESGLGPRLCLWLGGAVAEMLVEILVAGRIAPERMGWWQAGRHVRMSWAGHLWAHRATRVPAGDGGGGYGGQDGLLRRSRSVSVAEQVETGEGGVTSSRTVQPGHVNAMDVLHGRRAVVRPLSGCHCDEAGAAMWRGAVAVQ